MSKTTRCAIYHRVSTLDQDQTGARDELRAAATARGMTVTLESEETGSGARNDRPGLAKVMDAARHGKIDAVLVRHLDRFGRSALDLLANIQLLEDAGVRFVACAQSLDIKANGDAISKLILSVLAGVASFERELLRERTRLGLSKAKAAGKLLGRRVSRDAPQPHVVQAAARGRPLVEQHRQSARLYQLGGEACAPAACRKGTRLPARQVAIAPHPGDLAARRTFSTTPPPSARTPRVDLPSPILRLGRPQAW